MQPTPDRPEGLPTRRLGVASGRFLLAAVVISELACLAVVAAIVL